MNAAMPEQGDLLLKIARGAVEERLGGPELDVPDEPWLQAPGAAFVTLRKKARLHGCIGTVDALRPLGATVARNAKLAAFDDPRSRPLGYGELEAVRIEVSVLGESRPFPVSDEADAIARLTSADGVVLSLGQRRGVFLPQVWQSITDARGFLGALKEKAGLSSDFWSPAIELHTFAVQKFCEPGYGIH
jgi:AmmeMemoRadiSam system protein A